MHKPPHHKKKFSFLGVRSGSLLVLALFIAVSTFAVASSLIGNTSSGFKSAEVAFSDPSDGMQIIPASCPSNPYDAQSPNGCGPASCSISLSPTTVSMGASSRLSWSSSGADSVYISNVGSKGTSGSTTVAPTSTTQYYILLRRGQ